MANNQQAERDEDVIAYMGFAGLQNQILPERFAPTDLLEAVNINIDDSGMLSRRPGSRSIAQAVAHSLWADRMGQSAFVVVDGALCTLAPNLQISPITNLSDVLSRASFEKVNDRVYYSNGSDTGIIEQGAARSWGLLPPTLPAIEVISGYMPAGTYQVTCTYFRADGQESGAPGAAVIQVGDNSGLQIQPPLVAPAEAVAIGIYLTPPNGDMLFQAAVIPVSQGAFTYLGDTTELSLPLYTQFQQQAPGGQLVAAYRGRMFVAQGNILYGSQPFGYELFDLRDYLALDGRITLLAPMYDKESNDQAQASGFFIGTDKSCGVLVGSSFEDFQYVPKLDYGAVEGALTYIDGMVLADGASGGRQLPVWLSQRGICAGQADMAIRNLTRPRYDFSPSGQGAALFVDEGSQKAIFTSSN